MDPRVRFLARSGGTSFFFTPGEIVMRRSGQNQLADVVRMRFAGSSDRVRLTGSDPLPGKTNYFLGSDPAEWHRGVTSYGMLKYSGVYPGIDVVCYGNQRQLEYDIVVSPGAHPGRIALAFQGVTTLSIDQDGNLVLETLHGTIVQKKPVIYQQNGSFRQPVAGGYVLLGGQRAGFIVPRYDRSRPLVIDPVLVSSTYLGGSGNDVGRAIAIDSAGNSYVTGETLSLNFPGAGSSAIQSANAGGYDVFVAKLNAAGSALVYTTYLGGSNHDFGYAIAVDGAGNAYVTGETSSPTVPNAGSSPFPTVGPFQASYGLGGDAFITKINAAGNSLLYSSYYGNSGGDRGYGIAVDSSGSAFVTGSTNSTTLPGGVVQIVGNNYDTFVAKVNAAGSGLLYSVYLGGSGSEFSTEGGGIAIDAAGNAYLAGTTTSTNFPGTSSSTIQPIHGGELTDGFVAKLNATGSALIYSTYLGGAGREQAYGIAIDGANNAYVSGVTNSANFPTAAALQPALAAPGNDAFITKINAAGTGIVYSTYLGGTGGDVAYAIAVDGTGSAYVSGWTDSSNFPSVAPIQALSAGSSDMFVSALNPAGSALLYSTYLGGSNGAEHGYGIAADAAGKAHVTGSTVSTNFPTAGAPQSAPGGSTDAFVVVISTPMIAKGDFTNDGKSDILWRNMATGDNVLWTMDGVAYVSVSSFPTVTDLNWKLQAVGDYNADSKSDIVWRNAVTGQNVTWFMDGSTMTSFAYPPDIADVNWSIQASGDLNRDGQFDLLWRNGANGLNVWWYMSGANLSAWGFLPDIADLNWKMYGSGDLDGDSKWDLVWRNSANGLNVVWMLNGNAFDRWAFLPDITDLNWKIQAVADYNRDGQADLIWRNMATGQNVYWIMNGPLLESYGFLPTVTDLNWQIVGPR